MAAQASTEMNDSQLPSPLGTQLLVDVRGAEIISSNSDDPSVLLPHHEEGEAASQAGASVGLLTLSSPCRAVISHIALDVSHILASSD